MIMVAVSDITKFKRLTIMTDIAMLDQESGKILGYVKEITRKSDGKILGYLKTNRMGMAGCRPYLGRFHPSFVHSTIETATAKLKHYVM